MEGGGNDLTQGHKTKDSQDSKPNILTLSPVCFYHVMVISVKIVYQKLSGNFIFLAS